MQRDLWLPERPIPAALQQEGPSFQVACEITSFRLGIKRYFIGPKPTKVLEASNSSLCIVTVTMSSLRVFQKSDHFAVFNQATREFKPERVTLSLGFDKNSSGAFRGHLTCYRHVGHKMKRHSAFVSFKFAYRTIFQLR